MKRRKWDSKTKARIVLEGLSGRSISELCSEYEISQNQYYIWRDKFLKDSHKAFENQENGREVERLKKKSAKLERIIGRLTVELKKTEDELG
jgi:transposase-like protein